MGTHIAVQHAVNFHQQFALNVQYFTAGTTLQEQTDAGGSTMPFSQERTFGQHAVTMCQPRSNENDKASACKETGKIGVHRWLLSEHRMWKCST